MKLQLKNYFNHYSSIINHKSSRAGFTLVELLVVIGILGILATGLLATIDPLEQLNRGTDSNSKSSAIELINGLTRYYANHQKLPWIVGLVDNTCSVNASGSDLISISVAATKEETEACIDNLITDGELKTSFKTSSTAKGLYIGETTVSGDPRPIVCYQPLSKAETNSVQTVYNIKGVKVTGCTPGTANCSFWCAQ